MKASDVMSAPVITVTPDASVREVARTLARRRISGVPVVEAGRVVGIVSEADLLGRRLDPGARRAEDVMSREVATVSAETPIEDVATVLAERNIKRVPVMEGGQLVGIVTRANLVQALALVKPLAEEPAHDDAQIRAALLERLAGAPWWRRPQSNIVVEGGIVHLWGTVYSEDERAAARSLAAGIPGVRGIEDHRVPAPKPAARPAWRVRRAAERGHTRQGWVEIFHSFSFGNFYDPAHMRWGPLRGLNEKRVQPGRGSSTYGVRDVEIVTYVLDGVLACENSLDETAELSAGDVQCLSAGTGARFSEENAGDAPLRFLRAWMDPECGNLPSASSCGHFPAAARRGRLQPIASGDARQGSLRVRQDAVVYAGLFDGEEAARLELAPGRLGYVHVARGTIAVQGEALADGDGLAALPGTALAFERGRDAEVLVFDLPQTGGYLGS